MRIAVCVATYLRPVMLADLLRSLGRLTLDAPEPELVVVVVDNDAHGSAGPVLQRCRAGLPWPLLSAVEPERNIALARNRAVAMALAEGADWVAFVDDDEQVSPRWLAELLQVQREHGVDIVGGAVLNAYPVGTPRWVVGSGLPRHLELPTGSSITTAETSNALVSRRALLSVEGPFDPGFGRSGGSDSHFFLRARLAGARMVWAAAAVVHETIPPTRATPGWLLRRAFRMGNAGVRVARAVSPPWRWLPRRLASACYRIALGIVRLPAAPLRGRGAMVVALQDVCMGLGALAGITGFRYVEYNHPHGG